MTPCHVYSKYRLYHESHNIYADVLDMYGHAIRLHVYNDDNPHLICNFDIFSPVNYYSWT